MKNAGMAGAVALVGIGLITIGLSNFSNRAEAVPSVVEMPDALADPHVVDTAFAVDPVGIGVPADNRPTHVFRLWSNGAIDFMNLGRGWFECTVNQDFSGCDDLAFDQWLPFLPALSGYLPTQDMNGDRKIDAADLGLIIANWGPSSAALLFNPELSEATPVSLTCDFMTASDAATGLNLTLYRSWSSGLIEGAWVTMEQGACLDNSALACWPGWKPLPRSLPIERQIGDFDRSGLTDAADLGVMIGGWGN